jgi:hypothetical protein
MSLHYINMCLFHSTCIRFNSNFEGGISSPWLNLFLLNRTMPWLFIWQLQLNRESMWDSGDKLQRNNERSQPYHRFAWGLPMLVPFACVLSLSQCLNSFVFHPLWENVLEESNNIRQMSKLVYLYQKCYLYNFFYNYTTTLIIVPLYILFLIF